MTLWFSLALMTAAAVFAVLWPLGRRPAPVRQGADLAVYRDQFDELERHRNAGLIGDAEAEAARAEIGRRLIVAADAAERAPEGTAKAGEWPRRSVALVALALLPAFAVALYAALGSPALPGAPAAARTQAPLDGQSIEGLVARVEQHLSANPEDGRGWEVLAPVYLRMGRFDDAVRARRNALRLNGTTGARETDLGEALTYAANGVVTGEAREAFERAVKHDPKDVRARYFLGLAAEQSGQPGQAAAAWRALLADAPSDAPWAGIVRSSLARVDGTSTDGGGPSAEDVAAAANLSAEERATMVRGMVERLAERLKRDGSDIGGWLRLVRAYMVLGEPEKAKAVAADARRAAANDDEKLRRIDELMKTLGLET